MPRKDTDLSEATQRIAEGLKRLADPDHPLQKIRQQLADLPDDQHPFRKIRRALADLPEDHPFRKMGQDLAQAARRLAELREQGRQREPVKKKTKPELGIPHLEEALEALAAARTKDKKLYKPKAGAQYIMTFLKNKRGVDLPDSRQRTVERRIAKSLDDKSAI